MSSPFLHRGPDEKAEAAHPKYAQHESRATSVRITVTVANRYTFDTEVITGRQIKETAGVPEGFALYRRVQGGNERIADDEQVELRSGDHFFARPSSDTP
jgi:hypothetical protein